MKTVLKRDAGDSRSIDGDKSTKETHRQKQAAVRGKFNHGDETNKTIRRALDIIEETIGARGDTTIIMDDMHGTEMETTTIAVGDKGVRNITNAARMTEQDVQTRTPMIG